MNRINRFIYSLVAAVCCLLTGSAQAADAPAALPKALVVVGPWGDMFRWREAMHSGGVLYEDAYRAMNVYHGGVRMYGLPQTPEQLAGYSTVVLANIDAPSLGPKWLAMLRDFVDQGGGLVVLGGEWAYGRGGYADTPLAEMIPVDMPPEYPIPVDRAGTPLKAESASSWPSDYAFDQTPRSFYSQTLAPRKGATVELRVGERPAIVSGSFGKGRVVACALTTHGKPPTGTLAFWDWTDWPRLLGRAVDWSAANRTADAATSSTLKPLAAEEVSQVKFRFQPLTAEFAERFAIGPNAETAGIVFEQLFADKPIRVALSPAIVGALARFAEPAWEKQLLKWSDSLNPEAAHRNAAIELLGASRGPAASERLLKLLPDSDVTPAVLDGFRRLDDPKHLPILQSLYERTLPTADFRRSGTPGWNSPAALRQGVVAMHAAAALYSLGDPQGSARMAKLYAEVQLLRRIYANAAKRRVADTDATGIAIRAAIYTKADDLRQLEAFLLEVAGPIPPRGREAFLDYAKSAADDAEIRWLTAGLLRSTTDDLSPLTTAQDGIVRRIALLKK
ncbi:MAG: glutamine amidotransferase [Planctomycetia bacterium]|nr:glutamine amidotransferase [Planctomycetia bacterium]